MTRRVRDQPASAGMALREGFAILFTWAGLAVLLAWGLGRVINDRFGWSQYLWWIPSVVAAVIAGMCLLLAWAAASRRRFSGSRFVLLCALAGCIGWIALAEWNVLRGRAEAGPDAWRVLYWNMAAKDAPRAPRLLERLDADLIVLANPAYSNTRGELEAALARTHTLIELPECLIAWKGDASGSGFTSLALGAARPGMDPATDSAAIDNGWIAWTRLTRPGTEPLVLWVIDLPADPFLSRIDMMRRAKLAAARVRSPLDNPDLLVGDFNTPRGSASLHALVGTMTEAFAACGRGAGATWPRHLPLWALDQVFTGDALRPVSARVLDPASGTHRVVVADLAPARE